MLDIGRLAKTPLIRNFALIVLAVFVASCGSGGSGGIAPVASQLALTAGPSSPVAAGTTFQVTVSLKDAGGNPVSTDCVAVSLALDNAPSGVALNGTLSRQTTAGQVVFTGLSVNKAASGYAITASASGLASCTSAAFTVDPGPAAILELSGVPATVYSHVGFPVSVTAKDLYGNIATAYCGTVHFTCTDVGADASPDYTFTTNDNGTRVFAPGFTITTSGQETITATDTLDATITGAALLNANQPKLVFTFNPPDSIAAGAGFSTTVSITDVDDNLLPVDGVPINLALESGPSGAVLGGTLAGQTTGGQVVFTGLNINKVGSVTLAATSSGINPGTSSAFTIVPANPARLEISGAPATAASTVSFTMTVTAKDPYGNIAPTFRGTISFISSDPAATLPASYTFTAGDNGIRAFVNAFVLRTVGQQSVVVSSSGVTTGSVQINVE